MHGSPPTAIQARHVAARMYFAIEPASWLKRPSGCATRAIADTCLIWR